MGNAGSTKGQIWRCSRTFRYSDSPLKCPLSRIIQWSSNDQIIHHTYTYNAAKAQNGVRESFAKGLFFFSSEDGARLGIRNLINAHFFFYAGTFVCLYVSSSLEVNHGFMVRSVLSFSSPLTWRLWVLHVSLWIAWANWPEMLWQKGRDVRHGFETHKEAWDSSS